MTRTAPYTVISNGYSQFNTAHLAAEMHAKGMLAGLITGGYPRPGEARRTPWGRFGPYRRYRSRRVAVPDDLIWPIWSGEALSQASQLMWRLHVAETLQSAIARASLVRYQHLAADLLRHKVPNQGTIYHYRSGFGGISVEAARDLGMKTLCDHSIVHPSVLGSIIMSGGRLPVACPKSTVNSFWRTVEADLLLADIILVNSHFVRETFLMCGIASERLQVIYWGPDTTFLNSLDSLPASSLARSSNDRIRLLTAGTMEERKGTHILAMALEAVSGVGLDVHLAGNWHRRMPRHRQRLESMPHVRLDPNLDRDRLAEAMVAADVFVFPTLAEGSARVVFEAMAAGCYVITTPNAGSIVQDGVNGRLVEPGNVAELCAAIEEAQADPARVREIGRINALTVRRDYAPAIYARRVAELYESLLSDGSQRS